LSYSNANETRSYGYDGLGNRVSGSAPGVSAVYEYDRFNRLRGVTINGIANNYTFNALDQRVGKATDAGRTRFVYAGQNQLLAEQGMGAWTSYLWLGDELVGVVKPDRQLHFVHNDHLGRPEVVSNSAQQVVWRAKNAEYDRDVIVDQIGGLNLGFPGQYYDAESASWQNGFRNYDARVGLYFESDPVGLQGGASTYTYARANPISLTDALGLDVRVQWHPVKGPYNHTLIRITPINQARYANDPRFSGSPGNRYVTLGGGPVRGTLVSDFNRSTDAAPHQGGIPLEPCDEDALIDALFAADGRYRDNADYDLFPYPGGIMPMDNGWNSNSYVAGLLNSVGISPASIELPSDVSFPGWNKPLPIPGP
jgi:RHS repeat-associated protein